MRDPRAVVLSRMKAGFGSDLVAPNIHRWRRAAEMHREFADALGPDRYLLIRYEDLVAEQRATLSRVCDFLGIEMTDAMLEHHKRDQKGFPTRSSDWMENTMKPVFTTSVDKWKTEMKPEHIAMVDLDLGDLIPLMGYEPSGLDVRGTARRLAMSRLGGKVETAANTAKRAALFIARGFKRTPIERGDDRD
jgi:hypothetical protein